MSTVEIISCRTRLSVHEHNKSPDILASNSPRVLGGMCTNSTSTLKRSVDAAYGYSFSLSQHGASTQVPWTRQTHTWLEISTRVDSRPMGFRPTVQV
ncbi:hypothetical protein, variant 2 [Phialophora macrospora]|nr:hypothetical protein, variant 2 [Phialophora macrospora]